MTDLNKAFGVLGLDSSSVNGVEPIPTSVVIKGVDIFGHRVNVIETVSKAALLSRLGEVVTGMLIEKTGKEIKDKLISVKQYDDTEAASCLSMAAAQLALCDIQPSSVDLIDDYDLKGMRIKFGVIPPMFTWREIEGSDDQSKYDSSLMQSKPSIPNPKREYNKHIRSYVEYRVESLKLDTIINNIDEAKKYKLTAEQASNIGF